MKKYSAKELMIPERQQAENQMPPLGEIVQAACFALFSAKEYFESAELNFEANKPAFGVNSLVLGYEELGKAIEASHLLFLWNNPEKSVEKYKKFQKSHYLKLKSFFSFVKMISENKNNFIKIHPKNIKKVVNEIFKENNIANKFIIYIVSKLDDKHELRKIFDVSKISKKLHQLRLNAAYTEIDFKSMAAKSPYHNITKSNMKEYKVLASHLSSWVKNFICFVEKIAPIYLEPIKKLYYSQDEKEITSLKGEINHRVKRTILLIKFYFYNVFKDKTGKSIYESERVDQDKLKIDEKDPQKMLKDIASLIVGDQEIDQIYFYPPLKEEAKKYYSQFTEKLQKQ